MPLSENALDEMVARERERGAPPLTDWDSLSVRLRAEGLIREENPSRFVSRRWMQVAAGLALAVGGAAVGRMSAGESPIPTQSASVTQSSTTTTPQATNASRTSSTEQAFKSPEEAWDALNRAGEEYQRASAYLSASNTEVPMPQNPSQYRTRLAALDGVMSEIRGAMKEAPQDPVINQYYLTTVSAREATLRQLGKTLRPEGVSLSRL
jgi:hypothetical protein